MTKALRIAPACAVAATLLCAELADAQGRVSGERPVEASLSYSVAVASYRSYGDALNRTRELASLDTRFYIAPVQVKGKTYYRVLAGLLEERDDAQLLAQRLVQMGVKQKVNSWDIRPSGLAFRFATYGFESEANGAVMRLRDSRIPAYALTGVSDDGSAIYYVYAGGYETRAEAGVLENQIMQAGLQAEFVERVGYLGEFPEVVAEADEPDQPAIPPAAVVPVAVPVAEDEPVARDEPVADPQPGGFAEEPEPAAARLGKADGVGLRLGVGTDVSGGLAYGVELTYTKGLGGSSFELSLGGFGGRFNETTVEAIHTYEEQTDILVIAVLANYLLLYSPQKSGAYFVAGVGVGAIFVEWEERSLTDTSLGTPLPGGGSMQSEDGSSAGSIVNLGVGFRFSQTFDIRGQVPTFFIFSAPGEASSVVPTFTVSLGFRF